MRPGPARRHVASAPCRNFSCLRTRSHKAQARSCHHCSRHRAWQRPCPRQPPLQPAKSRAIFCLPMSYHAQHVCSIAPPRQTQVLQCRANTDATFPRALRRQITHHNDGSHGCVAGAGAGGAHDSRIRAASVAGRRGAQGLGLWSGFQRSPRALVPTAHARSSAAEALAHLQGCSSGRMSHSCLLFTLGWLTTLAGRWPLATLTATLTTGRQSSP